MVNIASVAFFSDADRDHNHDNFLFSYGINNPVALTHCTQASKALQRAKQRLSLFLGITFQSINGGYNLFSYSVVLNFFQHLRSRWSKVY